MIRLFVLIVLLVVGACASKDVVEVPTPAVVESAEPFYLQMRPGKFIFHG